MTGWGDPSSRRRGRRPPLPDRKALALRDLYVRTLIACLTGMIHGDPAIERETGSVRPFDPERRMDGRDWPSRAQSMAGVARLTHLARLVQSCIDEKVAGHFIETGVWRGGACILMRGVLAANGITRRKVFVADAFRGLPPPEVAEDAGSPLHTWRELAVGLDEVRDNFRKYGLLDRQVVFVEGWFRDTLPRLRPKQFALIRLDGDMYDSTMVALTNLYPRLSLQGYCVIDDYALPPCRRAVKDFRRAHGITEPIELIDWTGAWWRKAKASPASELRA